MTCVRRLLAHRDLAVLVMAAALLMKLVVPGGYMIDRHAGGFAITHCSGTAPSATAVEAAGQHHGMAGHAPSQGHGKAEMPCAFAGLAAATLGAADSLQLAALVAYVVARGISGADLPEPFRAAYLRPPLRGPPADR